MFSFDQYAALWYECILFSQNASYIIHSDGINVESCCSCKLHAVELFELLCCTVSWTPPPKKK